MFDEEHVGSRLGSDSTNCVDRIRRGVARIGREVEIVHLGQEKAMDPRLWQVCIILCYTSKWLFQFIQVSMALR